jgi:hypothetical protein
VGTGGSGGGVGPTGGRAAEGSEEDGSGTTSREGSAPQEDLGLELIQERWERVVNEVKAQKKSLGTFLAEGTPDGLDRGVLSLLFSADCEYFAEQVMDTKNREIVSGTLSKHLGQPLGITCRAESKSETSGAGTESGEVSAPAASKAGSDLASSPAARKLMSIFNAEVIRVVPPPDAE